MKGRKTIAPAGTVSTVSSPCALYRAVVPSNRILWSGSYSGVRITDAETTPLRPRRSWLPVFLLWLAGCANSVAPHLDAKVSPSSAVQEEHLLGAPPGGWIQIGGTETTTLKFAEFVPASATASATPQRDRAASAAATDEVKAAEDAGEPDVGWTEKITFERLLGKPVADPLVFLDDLKADTMAGCPDGAFHPVASGLENGYPSAVALIVCPRQQITDTGQVTMIKVIQGNDAFYTITRSLRTDPFLTGEKGTPEASPVDSTVIGGFSVYLRALSVCDPGRPEHPCPAAQNQGQAPGQSPSQ